jgi:hypothetical protein
MSGRPTAGENPLSTPSTRHTPDQISNREALRLEMPATPTKQTAQHHSNREIDEVFALSIPPIGPAKLPNSNREALRSEMLATQTKQRTQHHSNREKNAVFIGLGRRGLVWRPSGRSAQIAKF